MRILLIHNYYRTSIPSGENTSFDSEVQLLRDNGHDVRTYCRFSDEIVNYNIIQKLSLVFQPIWSIRTLREVKSLLKIFSPQIVHVQNTFPLISPSVYWACNRYSVPVVQSIRNYRIMCINGFLFRKSCVCTKCLNRPMPWPAILNRCYRDSVLLSLILAISLTFHKLMETWEKRVDLFIHLTGFAQTLHNEAGLNRAPVMIKPNFTKSIPFSSAIRKHQAIFIGRLSEEKGIITLIQAWSNLKIPLRIVGSGSLLSYVQSEAAILPDVTFVDKVNNLKVLEMITESTMLILPSEFYETFGRTAIEAYSCGVPVIASRLGAMAELVKDGQTGLLFTPGDAQDLAEKVQWAWDHPEEMAEMGRAARREYEERYTAERNYEILMEIYKKAIEHHQNRLIRNN